MKLNAWYVRLGTPVPPMAISVSPRSRVCAGKVYVLYSVQQKHTAILFIIYQKLCTIYNIKALCKIVKVQCTVVLRIDSVNLPIQSVQQTYITVYSFLYCIVYTVKHTFFLFIVNLILVYILR